MATSLPSIRVGWVSWGSFRHVSRASARRARIRVRHASPPARITRSARPSWMSSAAAFDHELRRVAACRRVDGLPGGEPELLGHQPCRVAVPPRQQVVHLHRVRGRHRGQLGVGRRRPHCLHDELEGFEGVVEAVGPLDHLADADDDGGAGIERHRRRLRAPPSPSHSQRCRVAALGWPPEARGGGHSQRARADSARGVGRSDLFGLDPLRRPPLVRTLARREQRSGHRSGLRRIDHCGVPRPPRSRRLVCGHRRRAGHPAQRGRHPDRRAGPRELREGGPAQRQAAVRGRRGGSRAERGVRVPVCAHPPASRRRGRPQLHRGGRHGDLGGVGA